MALQAGSAATAGCSCSPCLPFLSAQPGMVHHRRGACLHVCDDVDAACSCDVWSSRRIGIAPSKDTRRPVEGCAAHLGSSPWDSRLCHRPGATCLAAGRLREELPSELCLCSSRHKLCTGIDCEAGWKLAPRSVSMFSLIVSDDFNMSS